MKIRELLESKAPKPEAPKPRNFVAKNAIQSGAGAHKDKKRAAKQGDVKHKAKQFAEGIAEAERYPEPEQQQIDANRRAALRREREPQGSEKIDAMLAQQHAQRQEYEQTGKFWLKQKDTQEHISDEFIGKAAANKAALELLKQRPELKGNLVITAYGPGEKEAVGESATAGATSSGNVAVGAVYKNKPAKSAKNKDGTVKNALDMKTNLLTGGSLKR